VTTRAGAIVPAGWATYNGVWLITLSAFGGSAVVLWLYGGAIALTALFAMAVVLSQWRHPLESRRYQVPLRAEASIIGAGGICFVGLGFAFGAWLFPVGGILIVWAALVARLDVADRHRSPA
jgi:hypothetical protein